MKTLKENLPKERKPTLIEKDECFKLKNVTCIHNYSKFDKIIIQPFKNIIKDDCVEKFVNTCDYMFQKVGFGIFVFILNGEIHTFQLFANTTETKPGSQTITRKQVKMANKWEREAINSEKLMNAVRIVEKKQFDMITTFRDTYPECMNSESHHNDMLIKLFQNLSNSREAEFIKVMKRVAKSVVINKEEHS